MKRLEDERALERGPNWFVYDYLSDGRHWEGRERAIAQELPLTIFVNGQELATILCTPHKLNYLVLGFLYLQGLIKGVKQVASIRVCPDEPIADVRLEDEVALPQGRVLLSGCGSGFTPVPGFGLQPLSSSLRVGAEQVLSLMQDLLAGAELFHRHGGVHTSALADGERLLVMAEDIGRHNTLDKIQGECLYLGVSTQDRMLFTTGRLSSEMVEKAARMGVPLVATRNSPTERAIAMAEKLSMTLVGYVRGHHLSVYSHPWRIRGLEEGLGANIEVM